ncbi:MAG: phage portal protein [Planctomycetota bacterium]
MPNCSARKSRLVSRRSGNARGRCQAGNPERDRRTALRGHARPGTTTELPPGYQIKFAEPPKVEGMPTLCVPNCAVAASLGLTYEMLAADYSQTNNFSSSRMGHLESGRAISVWQRDIVINQLCRPVMGWSDASGAAVWAPAHARACPVGAAAAQMVDPAKRSDDHPSDPRAGLVTFPSAIQSMGGDPDEHLLTLKETMDQLKALGLTLTIDPSRHGDKAGA